VWRQAEHGNRVSVARFGNRHAAEALVAAFEQHHRKQLSWVEVSTELSVSVRQVRQSGHPGLASAIEQPSTPSGVGLS